MTWDAGMYQPASIGDRVWIDSDADGVQDSGETGKSGVTVTLYKCDDTFVSSTITDGNGNYIFNNLAPGSYYVKFTLPNGWKFSPKDQGGDNTKDSEGGDNTKDSDAYTSTGKTVCTILSAGENDMTWDAGMYQPIPNIEIEKTVWNGITWVDKAEVGSTARFNITITNIGTDRHYSQ